MIGFQAHADSVKWNVGPVYAQVQIRGDLILEEAQAAIACGYCKVSTCAVGQKDVTLLATTMSTHNSTTYTLSIEGGLLRRGMSQI